MLRLRDFYPCRVSQGLEKDYRVLFFCWRHFCCGIIIRIPWKPDTVKLYQRTLSTWWEQKKHRRKHESGKTFVNNLLDWNHDICLVLEGQPQCCSFLKTALPSPHPSFAHILPTHTCRQDLYSALRLCSSTSSAITSPYILPHCQESGALCSIIPQESHCPARILIALLLVDLSVFCPKPWRPWGQCFLLELHDIWHTQRKALKTLIHRIYFIQLCPFLFQKGLKMTNTNR